MEIQIDDIIGAYEAQVKTLIIENAQLKAQLRDATKPAEDKSPEVGGE